MPETETTTKQPNLKKRLILLYIGSFIVSIAPLLIVLIVRWGNYTKTPSDTVKLCFGAVICIVFMVLKVIGKLKMPSRIITFAVVMLLAFLLQSLTNDLILLSGMALLGEALDLVFQHFIKKTKEQMQTTEVADATTAKVEEVMKKYLGNGRV